MPSGCQRQGQGEEVEDSCSTMKRSLNNVKCCMGWKRSQSASSHASLDYIEIPEYYRSVSDSD